MLQPAAPVNCILGREQSSPQSLADQRLRGPLEEVCGDLESLALLGTQLGDALVTTNNGAALISAKGGYAAYQNTSMPFRLSRRRASLRVAASASVRLFRSEDRTGPPCLLVANANGQIIHRIVAHDAYDLRVIGSLETRGLPRCAQQDSVDLSDVTGKNIVSLAAVKAARETWPCSDAGHHLNDMIFDGGFSRAQTLPHVGEGRAWQVTVKTVPSFITYLADKGIGHACFVPVAGLMQGGLVREAEVSLAGQILIVKSDSAQHFALDLDQVATAWVTRFGLVSQLEIYDQTGRAIAVIVTDPISNFGDWNALLASLPRASRFGLN